MQQFGVIILIVILVIIAFYAVFQGNPSGIAFKNIFSGFSTSTSPYYYNPVRSRISQPNPSSSGNFNPSGNSSPSGSSNGASGQRQINPSEIPIGFTIRDISPYFKKIGLSASPGSPGFYSQVTFTVQSSQGERVNVTGWLLRGNRGSIYVPQAVDVYDPSGLSPDGDMYLQNGDTVRIYSTTSAISRNLHLNKCIGYLSNTNTFTPPLPLSCPYVNRSDIASFTGPCQSYILSLGSCQLPAPNPPIPQNDFGCRAFLDKLNYGGCFSSHRVDYDFFMNQWWVWTGSQFLDFQHDRLLLFDRQGLLVNEYSY